MTSQLKTLDARSITRLPCRIAVAKGGKSAPLGELTDISLDGAFIATAQPLTPGSVIPLVFTPGTGGPQIRVEAEVVHATSLGMGVRWVGLSKQDLRRLRRYVTDLTNVVNNQQVAKDLATGIGKNTPEPVKVPEKIRAMMLGMVGKTPITIIPQDRPQRERLRLMSVEDNVLRFLSSEPTALKEGDAVFGLYTYDYASYSFESTVSSVTSGGLSLVMPAMVRYSERRTNERERQAGSTVSFELPWRAGETITCPLLERTSGGMSFAAPPDQMYFQPNVKLPPVTIRSLSANEIVEGATVRHMTAAEAGDGRPFIKVGVAFARGEAAAVGQERLGSENLSDNVATKWGRDFAAKASYLLHKTLNRVRPQERDNLPMAVQFHNSRGQTVAGLLNMTTKGGKKERMPVVIVTPGFGARKETMSALGYILAENFRRNHKDIAVLRFDGTNAIGESYKDPGSEGDGRENLRYTVSGGVSDILGAVRWAKRNPLFEATDIVLISVSFSAVAVRHALTLPELAGVRQWVSFMGAPDAQNAVMNLAGNVDPYAYYLAGKNIGIVSIIGCLVDAHNTCDDMHKLRAGTLEDARRDMALVKANVTWFIGRNDAYMDAARVKDIMAVKASGKRQIIEVNAGHVPQSSDEAMAEFALMSRYVWRELYGTDIPAHIPAPGKVAVVHEYEWNRVRKGKLDNQQDYWKGYLLGGTTGLGYDVWSLTKEYDQLLNDTVGMADVTGKKVLDLGTGTGNLTKKMLVKKPQHVTSLDLVPEAIARLEAKLGPTDPVTCVAASADGNARVAMRRWLCGDLHAIDGLIDAFPAALQVGFQDLRRCYSPALHTYLRGADLDVALLARNAKLNMGATRDLQALRTLLQCAAGVLTPERARETLPEPFRAILELSDGLPFAHGTFDLVVSSLVISYMERVEDTLFEVRRVLRPGGIFIASTLLPDADSSKVFMEAIHHYEKVDANALPDGMPREVILQALREFVDRGAGLLRLQEEGVFHFWSADAFRELFIGAGFREVVVTPSFGDPAQACIAIGRKV